MKTKNCICSGCGNEHEVYEEENEDYTMLARENKALASALSKLGYTNAQISDIANGAI